jgi:hypothetical protein
MDHKETGCEVTDWVDMVQDKVQLLTLVNRVMKI